jgi:hypothetical protein
MMDLIRQTNNNAPTNTVNTVQVKASQQQQQHQPLRHTTSTAAGTISGATTNVIASTQQCLEDDELATADGIRSLTEYQYQMKTVRRKKLRSSTTSNTNATINLNSTGTSRRSVSGTTVRVGFSGNSIKQRNGTYGATSKAARAGASKLHVYSGSVFDHKWLASLDSSITTCIQGTRY